MSLLFLSGIVLSLSLAYFYGHIQVLKKIRAQHQVYALAPTTHQSKQAVSMGGLAFLGVSVFLLLSYIIPGLSLFASPAFLWLQLLALAFAGIGLLDDLLSLKRKRNQGLTSVQKITLQAVLALLMLCGYSLWVSPLSVTFLALAFFVILGASNATNLTDGVDGLLGTLFFVTMWAFFGLFALTDEASLSTFVQDFQLFLYVFLPVLLSFLFFNKYPAQLFMGDTGSLWMGALIAGLAVIYGNLFVLIPLAAPYILETLCVIFQVAYFKLTRTRIFLMSPFHHHLELMGLSEWQVLLCFHVFYAIILGLYLF